jgi:NADH:ubiquinone oxidoreductase subunit E
MDRKGFGSGSQDLLLPNERQKGLLRKELKQEMDIAAVNEIMEKFPEVRGNLIGILHEIQNRFHYLPEPELRYVSKRTGVPMTQIYSIANFYNRFSLKPKGRNEVCVCLGTACHVKGSVQLMNELERTLKVKPGESTDDMEFSVSEVRCVGACSLAPVLVVNEDTHGKVIPKQVSEILENYSDKKKV